MSGESVAKFVNDMWGRHIAAGWPVWMARGVPFNVYRRNTSIGASEIAALFGAGYQTQEQLWNAKVNDVQVVETGPMRRGLELEPLVFAMAARDGLIPPMATGTLRYGHTIRHPSMPISASPDGVCSDGTLVQVKTTRYGSGYGESDSNLYPVRVWYQCQQEQFITGADRTILVVLIGGQELRRYTIEADRLSQEKMSQIAREWWNEHVVTRTPPPLSYGDDMSSRWVSRESVLIADIGLQELVRQAVERHEELKAVKTALGKLKWEIQNRMGPHDTLVFPGGESPVITWKSGDSDTFNLAEFRKQCPNLADSFMEAKPRRTFLFKSIDEEENQ